MKPIQLWLPRFHGGIARPEVRGDMQRLFRAWNGEHEMWVIPDWTGPKNWTAQTSQVGCITGDHLEFVEILHISEKGLVAGPGAARFPSKSINGVLDTWLNEHFIRFTPGKQPAQITVGVPHVVAGGVAYPEIELSVPANTLPITHVRKGGHIAMQWPPDSSAPETVSPEIEIASLADPAEVTGNTVAGWLRWDVPFDQLQPLCNLVDDTYAQARMRWVAENSGSDPIEARRQAENESREWLSEGRSSVGKTWLEPILFGEGEPGALFAIEARFGVSAGSLQEAYRDAEVMRGLTESVSIQRAWGVAGLMWALLLDRLEAAQQFQHCKLCGRVISGRANKVYCSKADNPTCYRERRREDQRRLREH